MKKVLAIMLVCFMLVSLLPMGALAEEIEQTPACKGTNHYLSTCEDYSYVDHFDGKCGGYAYDVYLCNICGDYFADNFVKNDDTHAYEETKAPTCTEAGEKVCSICGDKQAVPALGHKKGEMTGDCESGWKAVCTVCGETLESVAGEHTWGEKPSKIVKEPNEETLEDGLAEYTCEECGEVKEVVILAHQCAQWTLVYGGIAPGCTTPGMETYFQCEDEKCQRYWTAIITAEGYIVPGEIVDKSELEIPAIGEHGEPEEMVIEATIEAPEGAWYTPGELPVGLVGTINFTYESYSEYVNVRIQHYIADEDWWETIEWVYADGEVYPVEFIEGETYRVMWMDQGTLKFETTGLEQIIPGSCTEDGLRIWQCSVCHEKVEENLGKNHNWAVTYHTEPTCTTYGYTIESCLDCGENSIERHDMLGHTERPEDCWGYGDCDSYLYYWYCERCNEYIEEEIPSTCTTETVIVEASCASYGYTYTYCTRGRWCSHYDWEKNPTVDSITGKLPNGKEVTIQLDGEYMIKSFEITSDKNPDEHNADDKAKGQVIEPTCTEEGLIIYWCTDCEEGIVESIPALGHAWLEELITAEPTCGEPGYVAHECETCGLIEVIEWVEFSSEYIYLTYESAASCHNLEGAVKEVFRPGICGEQAALDRYLCATCNQYILVKDDSYEHHQIPEGLKNKDEAETVGVPGTVNYAKEEIIGMPVFVEYAEYEDIYFEFVAPIDGEICAEIIYEDGGFYANKGLSSGSTFAVTAGETYTINIWGSYFKVKLSYVDGTYTQDMEIFVGKDATCTEPGYTTQYVCERCDAVIESKEIKAAGHKEIVDVEAADATCTENGCTKGWHCEVCDYAEESAVIPAKGHTPVLVDSAEWKENEQYGYEHYECTTCHYEYIINYESVCIHEWNDRAERDPALSYAATCTKDGRKAFKCKHCDAIKFETIDRLHHKNANGDDLEICAFADAEDRKCATCGKTFDAPEHAMGEPVVYEPNCMGDGYIMTACTVCDHYEVTNIEITDEEREALHDWSDWAPVKDENGTIVGEKRACKLCSKVEEKDVTSIAFSATIENAANAAGTITDGSQIVVTVDLSGMEDLAWGFKLNLGYSSNLTFDKAEFVSTNFIYAQVATDHDGFVTIIANADGDVEVNGKESIVKLYFTVSAPEKSKIAVTISDVEALNASGKPVEFEAYGAEAETVLLMELDGVAGITLADALAAYNLIITNKYDAAADLDKDGIVTLADYLVLFNYLSGAIDYEDVVALHI